MKDELNALRQGIKNALEQSENEAMILNILNEELGGHERTMPASCQISSKQVYLVVTDEDTGRIYGRALPIEYLENHNGITLTGENISAQTVKMAFLSAHAIEKIGELRGSGADKPRCHD